MRVRAADATRPDGSAEVRVRDDAAAPWRTLIAWGPDEMNSDLTGVVDFSADDAGLLVVTSLGANAERRLEVDLRSKTPKVVSEDREYDVTGVLLNPVSHGLEAVAYSRERTTWVFTDERIRKDFELLGTIRKGDIWIRGRDRTDTVWLVKILTSDAPTAYLLFDRRLGKASFLFSEDPKLDHLVLAPKIPVQFSARDGTPLHAYITVPPGLAAEKLPLVVLVHGGPWTRDTWPLDFPVQWLANRGYAVLQVNYRGSTGYGKRFQNAGNLELGGKAIQDLADGKRWAVAQGVADPARVAIMGGSYGGYAALAALTFPPGEFACGVAINAPSDLNLFMAMMPAYWAVARSKWETRLEKEPAFLRSISPLFCAAKVTSPVLLVHNANDVRVTKEHSERMAAALREHGKDATYLLIPGAGHTGGGLPANLRKRWAATEAYLGKHLSGRVEPPADDERWEELLR
jgi:dipeptidyl aminopeptidase/acylaminoacyl peptidase